MELGAKKKEEIEQNLSKISKFTHYKEKLSRTNMDLPEGLIILIGIVSI